MPSVTCYADADAYGASNAVTTNYNNTDILCYNDGYHARGCVKWSFSSVPAGVIISSATCYVYVWDATSDGGSTVQTTSSWTETGLCWNNLPSTTGSSLWSMTGTGTGWKTFDITTLAKGWIAGTIANWGLTFTEGGSSGDPFRIYSRTGTYPPYILVNYTFPQGFSSVSSPWIF